MENEQLKLFIETFIIFFLFLKTDIHAYGYKKRRLPVWITVTGTSFLLTCVNTLFYGSPYQYAFYIVLLLAAGILYTVVFIDAPVVYSVSLQLEMICCYTVVKTTSFLLVINTLGIPNEKISNEVVYYLLFGLGMLFCGIFLSNHTLRTPYPHPQKYFVVITVLPILLLILANLLLRLDGISGAVSLTLNFLVVILVLIAHYLSYLHISSYNELIESRMINQNMALLQNHLERSSALVEQIRRDKHEMKNVYFYIYSLLEDEDYGELHKFVGEKLLHRYERLEEFHTGCDMVDYLLSQKSCEAKDAGITFMADVRLPEELAVDKMDLCSVLQNLLDNAIDAERKEEAGNRDIQIRIAPKKDYLMIVVKNRYSGDILKDNPQLFTTKEDKESHGFGTRIIRTIVGRYDGDYDMFMDSGYVTASVMLKNVKTA